jgi:hypothetical protein
LNVVIYRFHDRTQSCFVRERFGRFPRDSSASRSVLGGIGAVLALWYRVGRRGVLADVEVRRLKDVGLTRPWSRTVRAATKCIRRRLSRDGGGQALL